jgi:hypothetical protein
MYGFAWARAAGDLPAEAQARAAEFQANDDGLLVWVGAGRDWRRGEADTLWGRTATIGTVVYGWGQPIRLVDADGNGAVVKIGDGNPDFRFGVSNSVTWRALSLYALVDVQRGGHAYNQTRQRMYQWGRSADVDQAGKPQETKKPVEYFVNLYAANSPSDWFVEDAGYVKLREVAASYRLPSAAIAPLGRFGVTQLQLSLVGRNLLTLTDYTGYDPEVGNTLTRLDSYDYPRYRTFTGTVQVTF